MSDIRVTIDRSGIEKLKRHRDIGNFLERVGEDAATEAARLAPRNTGRLADSVASTTDTVGGDPAAVVYFGEWYGKLWEFGHRGRSQPFLRPGVESAISKHNGRFGTR